MQRRHPDRCSEFEEYRKNKPKRRQTAASQNLASSSKERQTVLPFGGKWVSCRINQKQFDEKVAAFVIDGMHPLSIVENEKLFSGNS